MEYPIKIHPNPRPYFYFKKRKLGYYTGILESADTNVHEQITNIINKMYPDRAIYILDIASGEGALALRIKESRVKKQLADEIVTVDKVDLKNGSFVHHKIDLNNKDQFGSLVELYREHFDLILGIETIEHLENPKMYLACLKEMLKDDGHIFISTPNINNPMTRRIFYKKGRIEQFSEQDLSYGHVSIILPHLLYNMASSIKLKLMIEYPIGLYPKFWLYPDKRSLYITLCNLLLTSVSGSWCKLYVFEKEKLDE